MSIKSHIKKIGKELVKCQKRCSGIKGGADCDQKKGIIPRCLAYSEPKPKTNGSKTTGFIVVGLNPGKAKAKEMNEFRHLSEKSGKELYSAYERYFDENFNPYNPKAKKPGKYYLGVKRFIEEILDIEDPHILWTEVVKCQSEKSRTGLPFQTIRTCFNSFLRRELEKKSLENWTIIANGKEAYKACSLLFLKRKIIGISHTSGSRQFYEIIMDHKNQATIRREIEKLKHSQCIWLCDKIASKK